MEVPDSSRLRQSLREIVEGPGVRVACDCGRYGSVDYLQGLVAVARSKGKEGLECTFLAELHQTDDVEAVFGVSLEDSRRMCWVACGWRGRSCISDIDGYNFYRHQALSRLATCRKGALC